MDIVISNDTDMFPLGAKVFLTKFDRTGNCCLVDLEKVLSPTFKPHTLSDRGPFDSFTALDIQFFCVMLGCDFLQLLHFLMCNNIILQQDCLKTGVVCANLSVFFFDNY